MLWVSLKGHVDGDGNDDDDDDGDDDDDDDDEKDEDDDESALAHASQRLCDAAATIIIRSMEDA